MKKLIIASIIIAFLQSCTYGPRRVNCSAVPEWFCQYAPYAEGSLIRYTNDTDTMSFDIKSVYKGKEYKNPVGCKCQCSNYFDVEGFTNDSIKLYIMISLSETSFGYGFYCNISDDSSYLGSKCDKNPFKEKNFAEFDDTLRLENQYNKRFSNMVIVKGKGLTEFYDKENNCTWRLVE